MSLERRLPLETRAFLWKGDCGFSGWVLGTGRKTTRMEMRQKWVERRSCHVGLPSKRAHCRPACLLEVGRLSCCPLRCHRKSCASYPCTVLPGSPGACHTSLSPVEPPFCSSLAWTAVTGFRDLTKPRVLWP